MVGFEAAQATRVVDELGALERVGALVRELGGRRVLLVTDRHLVEVGHAVRAERALAEAGLAVRRFDDVSENPPTSDVERCLNAARAFEPDVLVGLGGGSAIDTAKGANFLYCCGGRMQDYRGVGKATAPLLPLVAVPTTAGTGTEVQSFALIADPETHQKMACGDPSAAPRVAILDATLTRTMPPLVTACTGLDAIGHAVESAVTTRRTPRSAEFAAAAFRIAVESFPAVLARPDDLAARAGMLRAAALAGLAIENSMLGAAHSMANPLTAHFDVPHGRAVGTALAHVVRYNAADDDARAIYAALFASVAPAGNPEVGSEAAAAEGLAALLEHLLAQSGLPRSIAAAGVGLADVPRLADEAARQWTAQFNPRPVDAAAFEGLFTAALAAR